MEAVRAIQPGEEILSEPFLVNLPISLASTHNPEQWLNVDSAYCGRADLVHMRDRMSPADRAKLDALYNKDPDGDIVNLVSTNCFTEEIESEDGFKRMVLRIYELISRVNHSCRPNAMVSWHPTQNRGYLRALRPIAAGAEITICYNAAENTSLQARRPRREALKERWDFDCGCEECSLTGQERRLNNERRTRAWELHEQMEEPEGPYETWQEHRQLKQAKIGKVNEYITVLQKLEIVDSKLGYAYEKLAVLHHEMFDNAVEAKRHNRVHCRLCTKKGIRYHLDQAWLAIGEAYPLYIRMSGPDHPWTREMIEIMNKIGYDRSQIGVRP